MWHVDKCHVDGNVIDGSSPTHSECKGSTDTFDTFCLRSSCSGQFESSRYSTTVCIGEKYGSMPLNISEAARRGIKRVLHGIRALQIHRCLCQNAEKLGRAVGPHLHAHGDEFWQGQR